MNTIKVIELIGTSKQSWEDAANNAAKEAQETIKGISGLEVVGQTARIENGVIAEYRSNVKIAFLVEENR
ncbi:MAG TPA: dodecin family protein [Candidatus Desulfaltia sp.]|nr:dodecin family protein [Candidatus Desulfaltia sp.]